MIPSSRSNGRLITLALAALSLMLALAACTPAAPAPTATPTPTPTPTPVADPFAGFQADATFGDLAALLPDDVTACLRTELGARYEALLTRSIFDSTIDLDAEDLPMGCFDRESMVDLFIASMSQAADGLSTSTTECLRDAFEGLDTATLSALSSGNIEESMADAMNVGLGLLDCLTDDEAERITAASLFGGTFTGVSLSLKDVRCVFETVDVTQMVRFVESMSSGEGTAVAPDFSQMMALLEATQQCGIDLEDLMSAVDDTAGQGGDMGPTEIPPFDLSQISQLPPELQEAVRCAIAALGGEENAQGFLDGTYQPEMSQAMAVFQCNVDLNALNEYTAGLQ